MVRDELRMVFRKWQETGLLGKILKGKIQE